MPQWRNKADAEVLESQVRVNIDTAAAEQMVAEFIDQNSEAIAKQIAADAKASVNVVTGNLRRSIRAKKSKFPDGGWIVQSVAPHSFLVEFGGVNPRTPKDKKVLKGADGTFYGTEVAPMPAKPFLRPALDKNIKLAREQFGAR